MKHMSIMSDSLGHTTQRCSLNSERPSQGGVSSYVDHSHNLRKTIYNLFYKRELNGVDLLAWGGLKTEPHVWATR